MQTSPIVRHSLKNRDEQTLTAECSVCGFVAIRKSGTGYQCAVKKAESQKAWVKKNPQKAAANRRLKSDHELVAQDYVALTAWCKGCELEVDLVIWGAGYACGPNARKLRTVQQTTIVGARCRECEIIDGPAGAPRLRADGSCPRCAEGPDRYVASHVPPERRLHDSSIAAEYAGAGFSIAYEDDDAYDVPQYESAVPGWKTIGSQRAWNEA